MAILLGAFLIQGLRPGLDMLDKNLTLTFSMVWTMVIANVITVIVSLLFLNQLAKLTTVRGALLIPFILFLAFIGAFTEHNHIGDLITLLVFGTVGYLMVRCSWPRAPLVLGFVLGEIAETNFYISTTRYGISWLYDPLVLVLMALTVIFISYPHVRLYLQRAESESVA